MLCLDAVWRKRITSPVSSADRQVFDQMLIRAWNILALSLHSVVLHVILEALWQVA